MSRALSAIRPLNGTNGGQEFGGHSFHREECSQADLRL